MSVQQVQVELDSNARRVNNGTALLGGSPFRLVRLSKTGSELLDSWLRGEPSDDSAAAGQLRARLIRAGLLHPVPSQTTDLARAAFVVPVYNDTVGLAAALAALRNESGHAQIVVVDDASVDATAVAEVASGFNVDLVRHDKNRGPAAARNTGYRHIVDGDPGASPEVIIFVDADVQPAAGSVAKLLAHFVAPNVAAVAPRVQAAPGVNVFARYEAVGSPLDVGEDPALVAPNTPVAYVPSAMLAVRSEVFGEMQGFDQAMRFGEDVDLIWRMATGGQLVRFEPSSQAIHRNRSTIKGFLRQRFSYGSAAAQLAKRHSGNVAPFQAHIAPTASTVAMVAGSPPIRLLGLVAAVASALPLARKLQGNVDAPLAQAAQLSAESHLRTARGLAAASTRTWAPLLLLTRRSRRALLVAWAVPALAAWVRQRPKLSLPVYAGLRAADHGAYCAGVWAGVMDQRSVAALLPAIGISSTRRGSTPDDVATSRFGGQPQ